MLRRPDVARGCVRVYVLRQLGLIAHRRVVSEEMTAYEHPLKVIRCTHSPPRKWHEWERKGLVATQRSSCKPAFRYVTAVVPIRGVVPKNSERCVRVHVGELIDDALCAPRSLDPLVDDKSRHRPSVSTTRLGGRGREVPAEVQARIDRRRLGSLVAFTGLILLERAQRARSSRES